MIYLKDWGEDIVEANRALEQGGKVASRVDRGGQASHGGCCSCHAWGHLHQHVMLFKHWSWWVPVWGGLCSGLKVGGLSLLGPQDWSPSSWESGHPPRGVGLLRGVDPRSLSRSLREVFTALLFTKESGFDSRTMFLQLQCALWHATRLSYQ